jgi:hypothetical protein
MHRLAATSGLEKPAATSIKTRRSCVVSAAGRWGVGRSRGEILLGEGDPLAVEEDLADVFRAVSETDRDSVPAGQQCLAGLCSFEVVQPVHEADVEGTALFVVRRIAPIVRRSAGEFAKLDEVPAIVRQADAETVAGHEPLDEVQHPGCGKRAPGHRLGCQQLLQRGLLPFADHHVWHRYPIFDDTSLRPSRDRVDSRLRLAGSRPIVGFSRSQLRCDVTRFRR